VDEVVYGITQLLDGMTDPIGNDRLNIELVLSAVYGTRRPAR
jgi:hypothetical protein